jgi:F-type H+-transporting ATPase subunit b
MNINATIIGQFLTFGILIWFTMRYVWPPIIKSLNEREKKIAAGLEAAEKSRHELAAAEKKALAIVNEAKKQASDILVQANFHSAQLIEEAKNLAKVEGERLIELAKGEIDTQASKVKEALKSQLASLAILGAEKILQRQLDTSAHHDLLKQVIAEI